MSKIEIGSVDLRFRQIHLDFHTSEEIPSVGAEFDAEEFAATLERAHVDSVTCFARCHHGWLYYDTKLFPERVHPHLARPLLEAQIAACHARGIRVPIYITVQWDQYTANTHPEWLCIDETGAPVGTPPFEAGFYRRLCINSPYLDFLKAHTREVIESMPADGIFFDIVAPVACACRHCRAAMVAAGLEPADPEARRHFGQVTIDRFKRDMTEFLRSIDAPLAAKDFTLFYNEGHVGTRNRSTIDAYSHYELETLPSGGWGYLHFPVTMRYARNLGEKPTSRPGLDCLGMTGKFHTSWGDFHSLKNQAALEFECYRMLALGAKCSIGDQLPPEGVLDPFVYDLVGKVYAEVERKQQWCTNTRPVTEIGVYSPEEFADATVGSLPAALRGLNRILEEGGHQFDIIDTDSDLAPYKLLILPDTIPVGPALAAKLEAYLATGGGLIASFESGLSPTKTEFALEALGVVLRANPTRDLAGQLVRGRVYPNGDYVDYLRPAAGPAAAAFWRGLPPTEHAMYIKGVEVDTAPTGGTQSPTPEVLAEVVLSYFNRDYRRFCSHRQTPSSGKPGYPGIVLSRDRAAGGNPAGGTIGGTNGATVYIGHPVFTQYNQNAPRWCKQLVLNAIATLLPEPILRHDGPSTVLATVNSQSAGLSAGAAAAGQPDRWIVHLLHYIPERRGEDFDVIEDVIPLHDLRVSLRPPRAARSATLVPAGEPLALEQVGGRVELVVPKLIGHQMIAIELED